ncbi:MAG: OmpA family protein [Coxiellaceae bacterium]|jgi:outer membrane protein OmpA-like peptidoglycan-associated protein|nr:OmpA family protein [Coxiellaceae bacterium]
MRTSDLAKKMALVGSLFVLITLNGCTTTNPYTGQTEVSKTAIGTGIGAVGGAIAGQLIGGNTASTLVGAGLGAAVGGITGNYMDRQDSELRAQLQGSGVQVVRVGKDIRLIMPGDITFENDRAEIRSNFYNTLNSVAIVLKKFNRTTIKVAGYASSTGQAMHNQELSERRARSVADYLISQHIDPNRVMIVGYGARYPIANNATLEGQARNRRVEITIHQLAG